MSEKRPRVLVAMSGGVDSSVAAALLVEQGFEVVGATMQVWDYSKDACAIDEGNGTCCSSQDVDDARSVADKLKIPFYVLNCEAKFKAAVIDPFLKAYMQGLTPLPCVNCNTYLKFDHLIRKMKELECDFLATGHYAQVVFDANNQARIETSEDDWKDQTYFLFTIEKEIVSKLLFPVGGMKKPQVREIAEKLGLVVAKKKDSTGICFVGNKGYGNFIEGELSKEELATKTGKIRRFPSGEVMANHQGIHHFTYGQGKGLGMDHHEKLFVVKIDAKNNDVWVGDEQYLFSNEVTAVDAHWLDEVQDGEELNVKIRYAHKPSRATVEKTQGGFKLKFKEPQRSVTPGQAAVLYRDKQLLGGGWITL